MQDIGIFIINNANKNLDQNLNHSIMQNGYEIGMSLDEMLEDLFKTIEKTIMEEFQTFDDNVGMQRATITSFKYEDRKCEIGEHYDTQRDYFWVRIYALEK